MIKLDLREICLFNFLSTVPPQCLTQLTQLCLWDDCDTNFERTTDLLCTLLTEIAALQMLKVKCNIHHKCLLPAILAQGLSLATLWIDDYRSATMVGPEVLHPEDLRAINLSCRNLMELSPEMPEIACMQPVGCKILREGKMQACMPPLQSVRVGERQALAGFRNLRRLYVRGTFTQIPQDSLGYIWQMIEKVVRRWIRLLVKNKQGAKMTILFNVVLQGLHSENLRIAVWLAEGTFTHQETDTRSPSRRSDVPHFRPFMESKMGALRVGDIFSDSWLL